ncbi:MAG: helix-turn-helix domain-containing protein [Dehalococcoidia bacterium]|nr:helix-turn-helix domain-containing protein [Dehalococcoidia bacterium]
MEKLLLKPSEVATRLGIGKSLTYELIAQKRLPHVRLGRCIRIPSRSLETWLQANEISQDANAMSCGTAMIVD